MLLYPKFLVFDELGAAALQVEAASRSVGLALPAWAHQERREGRGLDLETTDISQKEGRTLKGEGMKVHEHARAHTHTRRAYTACRAGETTYRLVGFCPTLVTAVGGHHHARLHLRDTRDDAPDGHQLADGISLHFSDHTGFGG